MGQSTKGLIEVRFRVPAVPGSAAEARRRVSSLGELPTRIAYDVKFVVSEFVSSAIMYAGLSDEDAVDVALRRDDDSIHVEVSHRVGLFGESGIPVRAGRMGPRVLDAICEQWQAHGGRAMATIPIQPWQDLRRHRRVKRTSS
jgi:anti-sigma regulatory factor (Ser/Thr protein kinase)